MVYRPNKSTYNLVADGFVVLDSTEFGSTNPVVSGPTDLSNKVSSRISLKLTVGSTGATTGSPEIIIYVGKASVSLTSMLYQQVHQRISLAGLDNDDVLEIPIDLPDEASALYIEFERFVGADYTINHCKLETVESFEDA